MEPLNWAVGPRELQVCVRQADLADLLGPVGLLSGMRPAVPTSWLVVAGPLSTPLTSSAVA